MASADTRSRTNARDAAPGCPRLLQPTPPAVKVGYRQSVFDAERRNGQARVPLGLDQPRPLLRRPTHTLGHRTLVIDIIHPHSFASADTPQKTGFMNFQLPTSFAAMQ